MKKDQLIEKIAAEVGLPKSDIHATLDTLVEVIYRETKNGGYVRLTKLGTFRGKKKSNRLVFNPINNLTYIRQDKLSPVFKPSQNYRDYLANKKGG